MFDFCGLSWSDFNIKVTCQVLDENATALFTVWICFWWNHNFLLSTAERSLPAFALFRWWSERGMILLILATTLPEPIFLFLHLLQRYKTIRYFVVRLRLQSCKQMKLLLSLSGVIYLVGKIEYSFWHLWQCIVYFEFVDVLCLCVSIFQMTAVLGHFVSSYFPWQSNLIRNFWFLCGGTWYIVDKDRKHEISCICFELPEIMQSIIISELCSFITNGQLVNLNVLYLAVPGFYILSDKQRMRWCDKDSCCEFHVDKATIHPSSHIWCVWHASTSTSSFWLYDCCNFAQGNNRRGDMTILCTACMSA